MSCYPMLQALRTPGLSTYESAVYAYLVGRANGARVCWPDIAEIQSDLKIKTRYTVCTATGRLEELKLIRKQRRLRGANHYFILDPDGRIYGNQPWTPPWNEPEDAPAPDVQESEHQAPLAPDVQESEHQDAADPCTIDRTSDVQQTAHLSAFDVQETAHESLYQEVSTKEESKEVSAVPALTRGVVVIPDVRELLFSQGLPALMAVSGRPRSACASFIGRQLKGERDNAASVLDAIRRAVDVRPIDAFAFVAGCLRPREDLSRFEVVRRALGTESLLAVRFDDEPLALEEHAP